MADNYEEEVNTALQNNDLTLAAEKAKTHVDAINKVRLTIAITGESGSGKSTLVNALRGITDNTEGAAETGVEETTMEPTEYPHPEMPNIKIWDLPGIGTTRFKAAKYLKAVGFEKYDFFIIVSSERFRENDAKLAQKIQKMKKKFYFVRSKIDNDIRNEKKRNPSFKEEEVLYRVRSYCTKELKKLKPGCESPKVFLVSGHRLDLYEFKDLQKAFLEDLPELQKDALVLALPNISLEAIEQKGKILERNIKWFTVASTAVAAVPVFGLSDGVDIGIAVAFTMHCVESLGLTPKALQRLSDLSGVALEDLRAELKSSLAGVEVTRDLVVKMLARCSVLITKIVLEDVARFVPIIGTVIAMGLSCVTTYKVLVFILKALVEDAQRVFIRAGLNTSV